MMFRMLALDIMFGKKQILHFVFDLMYESVFSYFTVDARSPMESYSIIAAIGASKIFHSEMVLLIHPL